MAQRPMLNTKNILAKLIAFDTTSRNPNRELMDYVSGLLKEHGIDSTLIPNAENTKANLYASVGPTKNGGVLLSGHTDVVPIDGQNWTKPPFELSIDNARYYGRGTADMKGFVACSIAAMIAASQCKLITPLHLALSYDEEIGCVGVRSLITMLEQVPRKPAMCIVGEPTKLAVATKHKGKASLLATCRGREGHSALAPNAFNAIHLACDLVTILRNTQDSIQQACTEKDLSSVPYTTVHVGRINANQALNIVPNLCTVNFEIRNAAEDNIDEILNDIKKAAAKLVATAKQTADEAEIEIELLNEYPGLNTAVNSEVVEFVKSLLGANDTSYVAFGTEGGLFSEKLGIPTVVCGPGSMEQGHKPDEYVAIEQIERCELMLDRLVSRLQGA